MKNKTIWYDTSKKQPPENELAEIRRSEKPEFIKAYMSQGKWYTTTGKPTTANQWRPLMTLATKDTKHDRTH